MENKFFEAFFLLFNFHVIKGQKVRSKAAIYEFCFDGSQLFSVNEFEGLPPNIVKYDRLFIIIFIKILETKDPYVSEVNEEI